MTLNMFFTHFGNSEVVIANMFLRFNILFNSILVISGRWADDNGRLFAMVEKISPRAGLELGTARSVGQR